MKRLYFLIAIILIGHPIYAQLYINEFMASNNQTIADEFGEYDDWIEIYNDNDFSVNLSSFYLTDDLNNPTRWAFPGITIAAKDYLLFWADDATAQGTVHTNFKLSAEGEQIGLYDGTSFVDSLTFCQQLTDISYGRYPDGGINWVSFSVATPNASNDSSIIEFAETPKFSHEGGIYSENLSVVLSTSSPTAKIYYTLDCSDPTKSSLLYNAPIEVNSTKIIRARTYDDGFFPSRIISSSYVFHQKFSIPTISIITDPANLWGANGIYSNPKKDGDQWERPATIEYFNTDGSLEFNTDVGLRIHGGTSRVFEKKSFRYYFRSKYGQNRLHYQLFPIKDITEFKRFVTSATFQDAPGNSAYGSGTLLRDEVLHEIGRRIEPEISLGNRHVALFLDGSPWGIYNSIERIDTFLVEINFGLPGCDIVENYSKAKAGTMDRWNEMIAFFETNDLSLPQNYEIAKSYVDIQNFTRYNIVEIYAGNMDWPDNNNIAFCGHNDGGKWKWLLWDLDNGFAYINANTFELATTENLGGTLILRKLLQNEQYQAYFANELADRLNTILLYENVNAIIDSLADVIRNDIYFEVDRWGGTVSEWEESVNTIKSYAKYRPKKLWQYALWDRVGLTIDSLDSGKGEIRINSIYIDQFPWMGYYFEDIPIELEAIPNPGYKFVEWSNTSLPKSPQISLSLNNDYSVHPIFELSSPFDEIIINEINYNSDGDFNPEDWIELYNPSEGPVDISGWHLKDDDAAHDFIIPPGTILGANGYLVVCRDQVLFHDLFPQVTNYIGNLDFGLNSDGDQVRIFNPSLLHIDSVSYDNEAPWPIDPDGNGSTLELINSDWDNTLPENWQASLAHGSPGQLTLALPVVNSFVVTDSSGATGLTDSRDILITMTELDFDGNVTKWHVNEDSVPPLPGDFILTSRPTGYHIQAAGGNVIIYAWVLDNDNQVSRLAHSSQDTIRLALSQSRFVVAGTVNYNSKTQPVSDVIMTVTDSGGASPDTTDANGNYAFSSIEAGAVTLVPNKQTNNPDAIAGSDALFILQYLAFLVAMTDDNKLAADVTEDGNVTGSDVLAILRYLAFYSDNIGTTGQWRFQPQDSSFTLNSNMTIDFKAYLSGDANLDWTGNSGSVPTMTGASLCSNISLEIEPVVAPNSESIEIPIKVITHGETMNTLLFSMEYDAEWLRFQSVKQTPLTEKFLIEVNSSETGKVHVAMASIEGIKSTTEILRFRFKVIAPPLNNQGTQLTLVRALANDRIVKTTPDREVIFTDAKPEIIPGDFALFHNYPNPFNSSTQIAFQLPQSAPVSIKIYNLSGNEIRTILNENKPAGSYRVTWDGKDNHGTAMPSGIYMLQFKSVGFVQSQKMIMMK